MAFFNKKEDLPKDWDKITEYIKNLEKKIDGFGDELSREKEKNKRFIQKIALKRYNPFSNVGGDQSFSVVLLDHYNSGVIITSLFASDSNRVYAKQIKKGKSEYELSNEEKELLNEAIAK